MDKKKDSFMGDVRIIKKMDDIPELEDELIAIFDNESIKSFQSSISKCEKALAQMTQKGANTTLLKKRLKALYIGLAMLENVWNQRPHHYTQEELVEARNVLTDLFPSIENLYAKSKSGSPQRTLLERRIKALELAVKAIDDLSNE